MVKSNCAEIVEHNLFLHLKNTEFYYYYCTSQLEAKPQIASIV
jgi:hypothetical protein